AARISQTFLRDHPDDLRSGYAQPTFNRRLDTSVERDVQRRRLDVGQIHRDLRDPVLFYEPTDRFDMLQHSRDPDGLAFCVEDLFPRRRTIFRLEPTLLANVERDRVRSPDGFRVQINV